jgi:sugar/nucleoside kinase (ribokinase family)
MSGRKGILAGGNWIIDHIKIIDAWPQQDALANILATSKANGGSPYNLLKDLALLQAPFPLEGTGMVGNDADGNYILQECASLGIHSQGITINQEASTSFTDVMTVKGTGRRTFFHNRGANDLFGPQHVDLSASQAKIFHLGYLLLLASIDKFTDDGHTEAALLFKQAKEMGFLTSADVVSESSDRFTKIVSPSLPYLDYLFVNEYEAEKITGIALCSEGKLNLKLATKACQLIIEKGVQQFVILHHPTLALAMDKQKNVTVQPSLAIPPEMIEGAAGAGDAFAAGVLYGLHENWPISKCLELGVCTAGASLFSPSCSNGVRPAEQVSQLSSTFGFRSI